MIVIMQSHATQDQIDSVIEVVEANGCNAHLSVGVERTIIGVIGGNTPIDTQAFEALAGVERVVRILHPFKLATRDFHPADRTIVFTNGARLGGPNVLVMAGPCAVESRDQLQRAAEGVVSAGVKVLRAGAFKPRTSPYSFQGLGEKGLLILAEVAQEFGLATVTEVVTPDDVQVVEEHADMLQIGARNMANYSLLRAVGDSPRPILLKRGPGSTIEELLQAAEYILVQGNTQVALCERGIRTFETLTRFTFDVNAVPVLKQLSSLPVVVDPSHATGKAELVAPVALAGIAAGADGLLIEVHPDPPQALSDAAQSLDLDAFARLMTGINRVAEAVGRDAA
ncbi:MAG: 3-deoxy-7-phosphoheptulonate synthase [Actinomycetota bacterium]|nr:3-deoxy-7-phosphoheptulonate synthase [Actinomycetota bacterium]